MFTKPLAVALVLMPLAATAETISGDYDEALSVLYAVSQPGSPEPAGDSYCTETFGNHVGSQVTGSYQIDTSTYMMSATASFQGSEVALYPMGLSGRYAFMSDGVPPALQDMKVNRIVLNMSTDQTEREVDVLLIGDDSYNCVLSNMAAN